MKKLLGVGIILFLGCLMVPDLMAQTMKMRLQTRCSFLWDEHNRSTAECELLSLAINGTINEEFSYAAFQHFNRFDWITKDNPLAATDWIYLKWRRQNWELQAGKQMIEYGGEEFDAAPIDMYSAGVYWYNSTAFSYGLNLAYWFGNQKITAQVSEMPITGQKSDMVYSLSWRGKIGFYEPKHSVNLTGQGEGRAKLSSLVLGNVFNLGKSRLYFDFINRWNGKSVRFLKDFSLVACAKHSFTPWMDVRFKYNYDYNRSIDDRTCPIGTAHSIYHTAFEFFPIKENRDLRFHLTYRYDDCSYMMAGVMWKMHILK